jgi:hypothetical protein
MNLLRVSLNQIQRVQRYQYTTVITRKDGVEYFLDKYGLLCGDCGVRTEEISEYFMVTDDLWESYANDTRYLCVGCLETRIGRTLNRWDFTDCPLNEGNRESGSARLRERLLAV